MINNKLLNAINIEKFISHIKSKGFLEKTRTLKGRKLLTYYVRENGGCEIWLVEKSEKLNYPRLMQQNIECLANLCAMENFVAGTFEYEIAVQRITDELLEEVVDSEKIEQEKHWWLEYHKKIV